MRHTNWKTIVVSETWSIRGRAEGRKEHYSTYLTVDRRSSIEIKEIYGYHYEGGHTGKGVDLPSERVRVFPLEYCRIKAKENQYRPISSTCI